MSQPLLDTTYLVETPEGIDLQAELAGPVPRVLAYAVDISIRIVTLGTVSIVLSLAGKAGAGLLLLLSFLTEWFYPVVFEVLWRGQTPGKKMMGLTVVNDDLTPIAWGTSVIRNLLRAADFMPFAYLGGLISMCLSTRFQRLGDLAAGTLVIHKRQPPEAKALPDIDPVMPPPALSVEDQRAIINFTQRHDSLSEQRQQELADILVENRPELMRNCADSLACIRGWGAWLLGAR